MNNRFKKIIWTIICNVLIVISGVALVVESRPAKAEEPNSRPEDQYHSGWVNSIFNNSVTINDTEYVFTEETRIPDKKSNLKKGEFVKFKLIEANMLAEISLAEPQEEDMYMKPGKSVVQRESQPKEIGETPVNNEPVEGGIRFENGKWVN